MRPCWAIMTWNQLTVAAEMLAKPGREEELRTRLLALIEPTRSEEGCIQYDLHQSTEEPGRFFFYEIWESRGHLEAHLKSAHLTSFQQDAEELLAEPPRIAMYARIG